MMSARWIHVRQCLVVIVCALGVAVTALPASAQIFVPYLVAELKAVEVRAILLQDPCFTLASPDVKAKINDSFAGSQGAVNPLTPFSSASANTLEQATLIGPMRPNEKVLIQNYSRLAGRLLDDYKKVATIERAYRLMSRESRGGDQKKEATAAAAQADKDFLRNQLKFMPTAGGSFEQGEAGGFCRVYACRVQNWVSRPVFRDHVQRILEIEKRIDQSSAEARDYLARGVQGGQSDGDFYKVFRAGKHVLVGNLESLKKARGCDLAGWGPDCKEIGQRSDVTLTPVSPLFGSLAEATGWYCKQMKPGTARTVLLTGGRDREAKFDFAGDDYLYIQNAPACTNVQGADNKTAMNTGDLDWDKKVELASGNAVQACTYR
jgi:hypothetical protein